MLMREQPKALLSIHMDSFEEEALPAQRKAFGILVKYIQYIDMSIPREHRLFTRISLIMRRVVTLDRNMDND